MLTGVTTTTASEHEIISGTTRAVVTALGGGLRVLEVDGAPLAETWEPGAKPPMSAGMVLFPFPNRVADGRYRFDGTDHQLELTEPSRHNAMHGFVRKIEWDVVSVTADAVEQVIDVAPHEGWPFTLRLSTRHEVHPGGLTVTHTVTNTGIVRAPFGLGVHIFVSARGAATDTCTLELAAAEVLPLERERNLPSGPVHPVAGTADDFRTPRLLEGVWLDTPFRTGAAVHTLRGPDHSGVRLWTSAELGWVQVFTADPAHNQSYPGRGRALAVEPMTCPPNALATGDDLVVLEPGGSWSGRWGVEVVPA